MLMVAAGLALTAMAVLTVTGKIAPWTGRFYSLLDPSYAKNHIPIIASVSEHQPTSWSSFYFDLQLLVFLFPAGLYFCFAKLTDANIFIILYGVTAIYFAVSSARLSVSNGSFDPVTRVESFESSFVCVSYLFYCIKLGACGDGTERKTGYFIKEDCNERAAKRWRATFKL